MKNVTVNMSHMVQQLCTSAPLPWEKGVICNLRLRAAISTREASGTADNFYFLGLSFVLAHFFFPEETK
jgi:hypothetical protein